MLELRPARPSDVDLLRDWDTQPHVISASGDDDAIDWEVELARDVDWKWDFIAQVDGRPVGIIQIIDPAKEDSHYWGEIEPNLRAIDIWIGPPADLGRGYGTKMLQTALDFCFTNPDVTSVLIDPLAANIRARRFYERIGFRFVENRTFGSDDCAVYRFDRPR